MPSAPPDGVHPLRACAVVWGASLGGMGVITLLSLLVMALVAITPGSGDNAIPTRSSVAGQHRGNAARATPAQPTNDDHTASDGEPPPAPVTQRLRVSAAKPIAAAETACSDAAEMSRGVTIVGNRPVGTYLCDYFPKAKKHGKGCTLSCPGGFECTIHAKGTPQQLATADVVVNHHGPVPKQHRPEQITLYYTGESNASEPKKSTEAYQRQYTDVVSFHAFRRFRFTWTHRFQPEFDAIAKGRKTWPTPKIDGIVVFVSRCGKGGRDGVIRALGKHYTVHSLGGCARTHRVSELHPECVSGTKERYKEKYCVFSKYRFALTLDNTREEDYVTEKVYHGLTGGPIPLYDGAPNVDDYLPAPGSILRLGEFLKEGASGDFRADPSLLDFERLVAELKKAAADGPASKYLEWRKQPDSWPEAFRANLNHPEPTCAVCAAALNRRCAAGK